MAMTDDAWNKFVMRAIEDMPQRDDEKHLYALFYYQAEVNNGGHHQYFYNWSDPEVWAQAISGARQIRQAEVAEVLQRASVLWQSTDRTQHETMDDFMAEAREAEFEAFDKAFYALDGALQVAFEAALSEEKEN